MIGIEGGPWLTGDGKALTVAAEALILTTTLTAIALIDARTLRIPDALSLSLVATGLFRAVLLFPAAAFHYVAGAAIGYLILALVGEIYWRLRQRDGLGLGDAKLFAASGAWLGWQALPAVLLMAALAALAFAGATRRRRASAPIPFGPFLAAGFATVWLSQRMAH